MHAKKPGNETVLLSLEQHILSIPRESEASQAKHQEHVSDSSQLYGIDHQKFGFSDQKVYQHYYWEVLQCLQKHTYQE